MTERCSSPCPIPITGHRGIIGIGYRCHHSLDGVLGASHFLLSCGPYATQRNYLSSPEFVLLRALPGPFHQRFIFVVALKTLSIRWILSFSKKLACAQPTFRPLFLLWTIQRNIRVAWMFNIIPHVFQKRNRQFRLDSVVAPTATQNIFNGGAFPQDNTGVLS